MSQSLSTVLTTAVCLSSFTSVLSEPSADLISSLPELTWTTNYQQYSGFLSLDNGHNLHYWFIESQNNPSKDPVTLWLNGGPGCSSLDGLVYEQGPFHVNHTGGMYKNEYPWNLYSNMLYIEAPIGVGFSYSDDGTYNMNDNTTADDNYYALLKFFEEFSDYSGREFYVTGESYGGVYVPSLVLRILQGNKNKEGTTINLKGFAVGNGLSSYEFNDDSSVWFAYFHGLIDDSLWNSLQSSCCTSPYTRQTCDFSGDSSDSSCNTYVNDVMSVIYNGTLNWYNIYGTCFTTVESIQSDPSLQDAYKKYQRLYSISPGRKLGNRGGKNLKGGLLKESVPCIDSTGADIYLNRDDVQEAIHVQNATGGRDWTICSDVLNYTTIYDNMAPVYNEIFNMDSSVYAYIYNGDTDLACNFLGDEWLVDDFGFKEVKAYREWFVNSTESYNSQQVAGWVIDYERISFVTVRGAGHMVPQYKPSAALKMFNAFLNGDEL